MKLAQENSTKVEHNVWSEEATSEMRQEQRVQKYGSFSSNEWMMTPFEKNKYGSKSGGNYARERNAKMRQPTLWRSKRYLESSEESPTNPGNGKTYG